MPDRVVVRVPATVANLGPGFDCLGLALAWHNEVRVERADALEVTASGNGADTIARDETNLVVRGLQRVLGEVPAVRIHQTLAIPFGRGFGSSASAIVGGIIAGLGLAEDGTVEGDVLEAATALEGHADNVAPCLLGGITVIAGGVLRLQPPDGLRVVVCVAPDTFPTDRARAALPDQVPRADAVANTARASMLSAALATGRLDRLFDATEDRLHQPQRFALMPDTADLVRALRASGIAAFLSGAGPSVAAFVAGDAQASLETARSVAPPGWDVRLEDIDRAGAVLVERS